jgi:hypothetical protein
VGLLLLLISLFLFLGIGSGSSGTSALPVVGSSSTTARSCSTVVTSVNGKTVRKHSCSNTSGGSTRVHSRVVVRCSARMTAGGQTSSRCTPPANP